MLVSAKGRYALRLVIRIALAGEDGKMSLREVSSSEDISMKYLEQLARPLVAEGILLSSRGKAGGYALAKPAEEIRVGDVLRAVEGTTVPVACSALEGDMPCERASECTTVKFWAGLDAVIEQYVDGVTVSDLAFEPHNFKVVPVE